jgi:hypothetical protein
MSTTVEWLQNLLRSGSRPFIEIQQAARAAHFTDAQVQRARDILGVQSLRTDLWALPPKETPTPTTQAHDGFFIAPSKKQASDLAERLKREGKIVTITPKTGGVFTVRWMDWRRPSPTADQAPQIIRGRWRDGRDARLYIKP